PFIVRSEELSKQVLPTLAALKEAAAEARDLWPSRIWKTAFISSFTFALALAALGTGAIYVKFKNYYEAKVAEQIIYAEQVINYNQAAFRQLAIAGVPVQVLRSESYGVTNPSGFVLIMDGADAAEMRPDGDHKNGCIFFTSGRKEKQIQQIQREIERNKTNGPPK